MGCRGPVPAICAVFFLSFSISVYAADPVDYAEWAAFLKAHVRSGLADYPGMREDRQTLDRYLDRVAGVPVEVLAEAGREERIAFWINLYNASVIRTVLDAYPIKWLDQIPAVFDIRTVRVGGEYLSLGDLRDHVLREGFHDERILTAISSGRMDSPRLGREPFRGSSLEEQLNQAAQAFVEDGTKNEIVPGGKKIVLSPVFDEFGEDFLLNFHAREPVKGFSERESAVIGFLLHHLRDPEKRLFLNSARYKIRYREPDPRLNSV